MRPLRSVLVLALLGACSRGPAMDPLGATYLERGTRAITELGPRLVGTPQEREAAALVVDLLSAVGAEGVASEPFTYDAWQPGPATVSAGTETWTAHPLSPSPSSEITALLQTGGDLSGAVALLSSEDGSRPENFATAAFGGARAMIRVTEDLDHDGSSLVEVGHTLAGATLVAVAVDRPTGEALRAHEGSPVTVDVQTTVLTDHVSDNLVGRITGSGPGTVYVTAHYDSWHPSESAFDNALGVAALVSLAKKVADGPTPQHSVVFLATSAEEQGLQGAFAWVDAHGDEVDEALLVLNLDVLWSAEGDFHVMSTEADLLRAGMSAAQAEGLDPVDGGEPSLSSDHVPFQTRGVPVFWCERWRDRHYHTTEDTADNLDFNGAAAALRVQWAVLAEAIGVPR